MTTETKPSLAEKMKAAAVAGAAKAVEETKARVFRYKANHVKRLILRNGSITLPDDEGIFTATNQEEYDYLEHLAASSSSSLEKITDTE